MQSVWVRFFNPVMLPEPKLLPAAEQLIGDYRCEIFVKRGTAIIWNNPKHIITSFENS